MGEAGLEVIDRSHEELFIELLEGVNVYMFWARVERSLEAGTLLAYYDAQDVLHMLIEGKMQLWMIGTGRQVEMFMISEIIEAAKGKKIFNMLELIGSKLPLYMDKMRDFFVEAATTFECTSIEIPRARVGWERLLPFSTKKGVVLAMELDTASESEIRE